MRPEAGEELEALPGQASESAGASESCLVMAEDDASKILPSDWWLEQTLW